MANITTKKQQASSYETLAGAYQSEFSRVGLLPTDGLSEHHVKLEGLALEIIAAERAARIPEARVLLRTIRLLAHVRREAPPQRALQNVRAELLELADNFEHSSESIRSAIDSLIGTSDPSPFDLIAALDALLVQLEQRLGALPKATVAAASLPDPLLGADRRALEESLNRTA